MAVRGVSAGELQRASVAALGLDPDTIDLWSPEAIASGLRRAAGFHCPCPPRVIVNALIAALRGLVPITDELTQDIETALDALVAYGDLLEGADVTSAVAGRNPTLLFLAPPRFVWRIDASALLLGVVPDQISPLPERLAGLIEYQGHTRRLRWPDGDLRDYLTDLGLIEYSMSTWLREPLIESSAEHLRRLSAQLASQRGSIDGLMIMNPDRPPTYYRGRWEAAAHQTGTFVARRPQLYGANLWCVVQLDRGELRRFLDLPTRGSPMRGCDEAWRLQLAIDAQRGTPQRYRLTPGPNGTVLLELFSPVPQWAQRRWDVIGRSVQKPKCLFAYSLPASEVAEEVAFLEDRLWLSGESTPRSAA